MNRILFKYEGILNIYNGAEHIFHVEDKVYGIYVILTRLYE